jgi:hypothetical protein
VGSCVPLASRRLSTAVRADTPPLSGYRARLG